ncbi:MAG: hypothetical protein ACWA5R_06265 [bacterium]
MNIQDIKIVENKSFLLWLKRTLWICFLLPLALMLSSGYFFNQKINHYTFVGDCLQSHQAEHALAGFFEKNQLSYQVTSNRSAQSCQLFIDPIETVGNGISNRYSVSRAEFDKLRLQMEQYGMSVAQSNEKLFYSDGVSGKIIDLFYIMANYLLIALFFSWWVFVAFCLFKYLKSLYRRWA